MRKLVIGVAAVAVMLLSGCGYNTMQSQDEKIKAAWSEVLNQYQRRDDLIPNLVNTVKGYAAQEQIVLLGVTEARAKVGSIQATPELVNDPAALAKFQAAQGQLTSALSRLLVVTENYPQLKSDQNFRDLQAQLDRKSTRLNSSHITNSYAVFGLKKKNDQTVLQGELRHPYHKQHQTIYHSFP